MTNGFGMHGWHFGMDQTSTVQLSENAHNATGAVNIFHMHISDRGRDLTQNRNQPRQAVDVFHGEINAALMGHCQQMQHRIGGPTHGYIHGYRIFKSLKTGNFARQQAFFILLIIAFGDVNNRAPCLFKQGLAVGVGGQHRAIARQCHAQNLGQTIHRIGGKHARTRPTGRAGIFLDFLHLFIGIFFISSGNHRINQINAHFNIINGNLAGLHRAARNKYRRNIQPHRRHQHAGRDFIAIGNTDHRISTMGIHHIFHTVGDNLA